MMSKVDTRATVSSLSASNTTHKLCGHRIAFAMRCSCHLCLHETRSNGRETEQSGGWTSGTHGLRGEHFPVSALARYSKKTDTETPSPKRKRIKRILLFKAVLLRFKKNLWGDADESKKRKGSGNPSQEGAGPYSYSIQHPLSAIIETSTVIVWLWQCRADGWFQHPRCTSRNVRGCHLQNDNNKRCA